MRKTKKVIRRKLKLNKTTKKRINRRKKSKRMSRKYQGRGGNKPLKEVNLWQMFGKIFNDAIEEEGGWDNIRKKSQQFTSFNKQYNDLWRKQNKASYPQSNEYVRQMVRLRERFVNKIYTLFQGKYPRDYINHVVENSENNQMSEVLMEMYLSSIYPFNRQYDFGYDEYPEEEKPYNKFRIDVIEPKYPGNKPMQKWQMVKNYVSPVGRNFIGRKIWANGNILSLDELEFWLYVFKIRKEIGLEKIQEWIDLTNKLQEAQRDEGKYMSLIIRAGRGWNTTTTAKLEELRAIVTKKNDEIKKRFPQGHNIYQLEQIFKYPGMEGTPEQLQEVIDQIQQEIDDYTF